MRTVAQAIHGALVARYNCVTNGNAVWRDRWTRYLDRLAKNCLPSGGGIDNGTRIAGLSSDGRAIKLTLSFHHHGEHGYEGWTEHAVNVRPAFTGLDIAITGPNRNDIKDYLADVLDAALSAEAPPVGIDG